jgi:hypothetical protein
LSLDVLTGKQISLNQVESAYYEALDSAKGALDGLSGSVLNNAGSLDLSTAAGRKTNDILTNLAQTSNQYIATLIQQGATTEEANAKDAELRQSFYDTALQMTGSKDAANRLTDSIFGIPSERTTKINADVQAAQNAINNTQTLIDNLHGKTITITMTATGTVAAILGDPSARSGRTGPAGYAEGGYTGPGGKYQPAGIVHAGEFVFTQEQTRKAGVSNLAAMAMALNGYAGGGYVDPIQAGEVSPATWSRLLGQGWRGRPGDRMEALYPPSGWRGFSASQGWIGHNEVNGETWRQLLGMGWRGRPGDRREAVYPPGNWHRRGSNWLPPGYAEGGPVIQIDTDDSQVAASVAAARSAVTKMMSAGPVGGAGVQRWSGVVLQALAMMGQPASLLDTVLRRMNQESGGNPRAINNWDINAKRGTPSKGLMQTIDPTFRAYHFPGTSNDVYDPLANILASMRYALSRYGSLSAAYNRKGGYAAGTEYVPETGDYQLHKSEAVLNPKEAAAYRAGIRSREVSGGWSGGGGGSVSVAPPVVKVYLDGQEWRGMARVEALGVVVDYADAANQRAVFSS